MIPIATALTMLLGAAYTGGGQTPSVAPETVSVDPPEVVAGMLYGGTTVRVSARVQPGVTVAIVCRGENAPVALREKGKVLGVLWMNVGEVRYEEIPELYLLRTSTDLDHLAPASERERLDIGFAALRASIPSGGGTDEDIFGELVRLKQRDGLWETAVNTVAMRTDAEGTVVVTDFQLPVKAPPGTYRVLVFTFAAGRGELAGSAEFRIRQGGVPAFIAQLATGHGLLYGVLAVVVAVAMGLLTGFVFGLGSRKGH